MPIPNLLRVLIGYQKSTGLPFMEESTIILETNIDDLNPDRLKPIQEFIFAETSTLGIRYRQESRLVFPRDFLTVQTKYGPVRVKYSQDPASGQILTIAPEYEDCKSLAQNLLLDKS